MMLINSKKMLQGCVKVGGLILSLWCIQYVYGNLKILTLSPQSDLKLKLQKANEEHAVKESNSKEHIKSLTEERDELLFLTLERGNLIQVSCFVFLQKHMFHSLKSNLCTDEPQNSIQYRNLS